MLKEIVLCSYFMLLLSNNINIRMDIADLSLDELLDLVHCSSPELQEACGSVLQNKVEVDVHVKHPFNLMVRAPSQSGKSWFVKEMLTHKQITPYPSHVVLAYKEWQPLYNKMKERGLAVVQGQEEISKQVDGITPTLLILDDLQQEVSSNDFVSSMFMRGSHHHNCSCVFIVQNLYFQGCKARDIELNAHYFIIFRNPGDQLQEFARST